MKKFIYTLLIFFSVQTAFAQDEDTDPARLKGKMVEYIENKLGLSKTEAEKFQPLFMDYLKELRQTKEEHGNDKLVLQQKVIEIRLKFRDQIKPIVGEKRSNEVFTHEREFVEKVQEARKDRMQERKSGPPPNKRKG
ncbi:MAG TPA: hypothetical protein VEX65_08860 [Flavisolibacter sp.]|jgi:hypothetical protein|nr:hypothetical protein [Flavisolibacter sp.]